MRPSWRSASTCWVVTPEDVKPAEAIQCLWGERLRIRPSRHIGPVKVGFTTCLAYLLDDGVAGPLVTTNDQHLGSIGRENPCNTFADASTGAGEDRNLAVQSTGHLLSFR